MGRKWNKMSKTLKQKFNKSKPEAAEPDTKPTDIQPEKEPVVQNQPNIEPQLKPDTEEESRQLASKPEVPEAGPGVSAESSELSSDLSDLIGRSNVGSILKLPSDEAASVNIKSPEEASEEPVAEESAIDDVVPENAAEETVVVEAAPDDALLEEVAMEKSVADEAVAEETAAEENIVEEAVTNEATVDEASVDDANEETETPVAEKDVAGEVETNVPKGIIAEQSITEAPVLEENETTVEAAEDATEASTEAIIDLNEVKSDGNQQIKSELQDQVDITEAETAEVTVDSAQGEGIPATD